MNRAAITEREAAAESAGALNRGGPPESQLVRLSGNRLTVLPVSERGHRDRDHGLRFVPAVVPLVVIAVVAVLAVVGILSVAVLPVLRSEERRVGRDG